MTSAVYTSEFFYLQNRSYFISSESKFCADYYFQKNHTLKTNSFWATALQISSDDVIFLMANSVNIRYIICDKSLERKFDSD